jgi:hypothetical protein
MPCAGAAHSELSLGIRSKDDITLELTISSYYAIADCSKIAPRTREKLDTIEPTLLLSSLVYLV